MDRSRGAYIITAGILSSFLLIAIISWSSHSLYQFEKKKTVEQIELVIMDIATKVQNENLTLNNLLASYNDKDAPEKIAFAIGMTRNQSKMQISFDDKDDTQELSDNVPTLSKDTLVKMGIQPRLNHVKGIGYFDSLLQDTIHKENIAMSYKIVSAKDSTRSFSFEKDTSANAFKYHTQPFIINYYEPDVFRVNYNIPFYIVVRKMWGFLLAWGILTFIIPISFFMYYRSYGLQMQMSQFKENLFSNMTHELKTPLSSLQLIIDSALNRNNSNTIPKEHLHFASGELSRMNLIIEKILTYGKLSKEQLAINEEVLDLDNVITEAVNAMIINLTKCNGQIHYNQNQGIKISGDRALLVNIFTALIDNSLIYNNSDNPIISIKTTESNTDIIIEIVDNGIGIPQEYHKKVFEPFFRIPSNNRHNTKGHGIGLSFVMQIVRLHNGRIVISNNKPTGTVFIVTFPK